MVGVDGALALSRAALDVVRLGDRTPILVVVDSDSQRMSRRDETLGLNACLAHLAEALLRGGRETAHATAGLVVERARDA